MLLTGAYSRSVDDKRRVAIPKRLRDALGEAMGSGLFIAPGTDRSLALYTEEALLRLAARLEGTSPTQHEVRAFGRLFYAQAEWLELDGQGRVRIPAALATLAGIRSDAVLLGVLDHMELWDRTEWERYLAKHEPHYDEIAERAFSRGLPPSS